MAKYEFAVKKDLLNSGKAIFTPVCREKSLGIFGFYLYTQPWQRIVEIYGEYMLMELSFTPEMTYGECAEHIERYQAVLLQQKEHQVATVEFHTLEEKEI